MLEAVARLTHDRRAERQKAIDMEELKSRAKLTTVSADPPTQMIELSSVVGDGREVRSVERAQVESAYAAYKARIGDYPRPEEDVTLEQLAALRALLSSGAPLYVDLAVWGPFGHRIQRKLGVSGQVLCANGVLRTVQLYGQPSVSGWQARWAIFKTAAVMLWELWPATQDFWEFMVTNHAGRYGATAWAFIHHADVRGKLEHTSRGRCDGAVAETQANAAGVEHPADHGTSCEWLFRETAHDVKFWHEERHCSSRRGRPKYLWVPMELRH